MQTSELHLRPGEVVRTFGNDRHRLVASIRTLRQLMGSRLSTTWNIHEDGIGSSANPDRHSGHEVYPSIFEYGAHLNEISGGDYLRFLHNQMTIRLAGWTNNLRVNPRTVYFAAAAQVLMDVSGHDTPDVPGQAGGGHWFATASIPPTLNEMQRMLQTLAAGTGRAHQPVDGGAAILTSIQNQLGEMLEVLAAQSRHEPIHGHMPDEHLEREFANLMVPHPATASGAASNERQPGARAREASARRARPLPRQWRA
jgi:hypothetical protein